MKTDLFRAITGIIERECLKFETNGEINNTFYYADYSIYIRGHYFYCHYFETYEIQVCFKDFEDEIDEMQLINKQELYKLVDKTVNLQISKW